MINIDIASTNRRTTKKESPIGVSLLIITLSAVLLTGGIFVSTLTPRTQQIESQQKVIGYPFFSALKQRFINFRAAAASHKPKFTPKPAKNFSWPQLTLSGFGASNSGSDAFAFINGKKYTTGETICDGIQLSKVTNCSVVIEHHGATKELFITR